MKYPIKIASAMAAYYAVTGVYQNYISKDFGAQGLTDGEIGVLMAAPPLISLIAQPVWGTLGDRARSKNAVFRLMYVASAILVLSYLISSSFWYLLFAVLAYSFFFTALQPMNDAIVLEALGGRPFGPIRMAGTLTFAIVSPLAGAIIGDNWSASIWMTGALLIAAALVTFLLPNVPGHQSEQGHKKMKFTELLKQKELVLLLGFVMPLQISMGYFYTYFSLHFTELEGANSTLLGLCYTISSIAEVPFLLLSNKLYKRFGAGKLLISAGISVTVRWILLGSLTNVYAVMATQLFHGWGFIVMTVTMAYYINDHVPAELKASGQMLLGVVGFGIARAIGNLGGAACINIWGRQGTFYAAAVLSGLAVVCYFKKYMFAPRDNAQK